MNAIAIGLCTFAGLALAGSILLRRNLRRRSRRRPAGVESADTAQARAVPWPAGWKGIPKSEDSGDPADDAPAL
jgi:hypothetical protein